MHVKAEEDAVSVGFQNFEFLFVMYVYNFFLKLFPSSLIEISDRKKEISDRLFSRQDLT